MPINKPKCTIYQGWSGPECGDLAISMNDYGGFQCRFHTSLKRYDGNKLGPYSPIGEGSPDELQAAYSAHLQTQRDKSEIVGNKVIISAHNVPNSMLRSKE